MTAAPSNQYMAVEESEALEHVDDITEWHMPTFAFHDLDYIPSGYSGVLAPYIETGPGTMRAAATLMHLDLAPQPGLSNTQQVICDLGCGDGEFLIGLLRHITKTAPLTTSGFGIDYNASLIATATLNAVAAGEKAHWLVYDFNLDEDDLFTQIGKEGVTHMFVYLIPKQLALKTVKSLLMRLCESGVMICCHKFQPACLGSWKTASNDLMDLVVYECGKFEE
ncbi:hypothetical protein D0Z07_1800 [Hyphodiscus hymeniophilus]|uniref:Methyltransferase domain-containing protein n=1 Tax=Hyphodiscus hymeniophilus TaxID=353542 RepID=A0A9P6VPL4_9HELO|nr:hypothetical protein D0Z07_1800 [Hyphodiscus hymeniophilus]